MKRALVIAVAAIAAVFAWANAPSRPALAPDAVADRIVVEKSARRLTLYRADAPLKSYRIALGREPVGDKLQEGDNRTPEGLYTIDFKKADSGFHRALHISYPKNFQRARAAAIGVSAGGGVMIHGLPNGLGFLGRTQRLRDWTAGCIGLTDREMDELWRAVPTGTPIEIRP